MSDIIDPELIAEVEAALPDFIVVPDGTAAWWFEMAHAGIGTLGLQHLHDEHCLEPDADDPDFVQKLATSAELLLTALRAWLQEHGVPRLAYWFSAVSADGAFFHAEIKGTDSGSYTDDGEEVED